MYKPPQNPFEFMLQQLQQGQQSLVQGTQQRVGIEEQTAIESGQLAQQDIRDQLAALDAELRDIPLGHPMRGQIMQARSALAQGLGLGPKEAGSFIANLQVAGPDGTKVPFGEVFATGQRVAQETREAREDAVRADTQSHELNLLNRQGEIDQLMQQADITFRREDGDANRALQRVLQAVEHAHEAGQRDLDRVMERELTREGFEHTEGIEVMRIEAQKILAQMGFDHETAMQARQHEHEHSVLEVQNTHAWQVLDKQLQFDGEQADKQRLFDETLQRAIIAHQADQGSLQRLHERELQEAGFTFEGDQNERRRQHEILLEEMGIEHEATQNQLDRDAQRDLLDLDWQYKYGSQQMEHDFQRSMREAAEAFAAGEASLERSFQLALQRNGFDHDMDMAEMDHQIRLLIQNNEHIFQGAQNDLMRGLQLTLQQGEHTHQMNMQDADHNFRWAFERSIEQWKSGEAALERTFAMNMQQAGFWHDMTLQEAEIEARKWLQENDLAWRATEAVLGRQHEIDMFERGAEHDRFMQEAGFKHNLEMEEFRQEFESMMQDERLQHAETLEDKRQTFEMMITERGWEWSASEAEKQRWWDHFVRQAGWEREDGLERKSLAATEFKMLLDEPQNTVGWINRVVGAATKAGYNAETAEILAQGRLDALNGLEPELTEQQWEMVKFEFEQELEGIKTKYPGCASASFENRMGEGCEAYAEEISDWNLRRQEFNRTYTGQPISAVNINQMTAREMDAISNEFEAAFPQAARISEEAFLAEVEAYAQAREMNLPYTFGDGIAAEGIGFHGTPRSGFLGDNPNAAMVEQVLADPDFQRLPEWDSLNFLEKQFGYREQLNEIRQKHGLSMVGMRRIWSGRAEAPEEIPTGETVHPGMPPGVGGAGQAPTGPGASGSGQVGPGSTGGSMTRDGGGAPPFGPAPDGADSPFARHLSSNYGARVTTTPGQVYGSDVPELEGRAHKGYDIAFPGGDGAAFPNFFNVPVEIVSWNVSSTLGNVVVVQPQGSQHRVSLGHLASFDGLEAGKVVQPGETLAFQGNTGISTGPHVDMQIMGMPYDQQGIDSVLAEWGVMGDG